MSAFKKSGLLLFCLTTAFICLVGVFTIIDSSSVHANQNEIYPREQDAPNTIIVSPTVLQASQYPDSITTQSLWITNTGGSPITYTIFEMPAALAQAEYLLHPAAQPVVEPAVQARIISGKSALVIIYLREQPDLTPAYSIPDRYARRQYVYLRLLELATHSQALFDWLEKQGSQPQRLLIANAIAARVNASQLKTLVMNPRVKEITLSHQNYAITDGPSNHPNPQILQNPLRLPATVEWNIVRIHADEAWETFGIRGEGAVVGIVDTGVMYDHPALVNSYRGNLDGGNFDHNYNWYDFVNGLPEPYDDSSGHGTMVTGVVAGDDHAGNQIGVAPGSNWIAVKACSGGLSCSDVDLHHALEWMLAPTDLSYSNPDPSKAPDVVLNGWGYGGCDNEFQIDLMVLRSAGILPIFPPAGGGPACSTIGSPAALPEALATGATDKGDNIASFSARGPALCNPNEVKPDIAAPGTNIRSSLNDGNYDEWSGTSLSAAHAAGAAALVISADQDLGSDAVQTILSDTALCIDDDQCGGGPCPEPNYVYGYGRIDAFEAVSATLATIPPDKLPWLSEAPVSGTLASGEAVAVEVTFDSTRLSEDSYLGALGIFTSDPVTPFISLPVTLNVITEPIGPLIQIDPFSFSVTLPVSGRLTETLSVANTGDSVLTFTLYEVTASQRLLSAPANLPILDTGQFLSVEPAQVDAAVHRQLTFLGQARLILYLRGQPDFSKVYTISDRVERVQHVYDCLLEASARGNELYAWLESQGAEPPACSLPMPSQPR
jgi:hypothetical protein